MDVTVSRQRQKPQIRRAQILDEAMRMLGDRGFNGLTVQALAERCCLTNAGLLYYFGSKDELLLAVIDQFELRERSVLSPLIAAVEKVRDDPDQAWPAIVDLPRQMIMRYADRPDLTRFIFVVQTEALDSKHVAHAWFSDREQMTLDLFVSLLAGFAPDPLATARHLLCLMQGLCHHWLRQEMNFDLVAEWAKISSGVLPPHRDGSDRAQSSRTGVDR